MLRQGVVHIVKLEEEFEKGLDYLFFGVFEHPL
jgi:hypothetical protein